MTMLTSWRHGGWQGIAAAGRWVLTDAPPGDPIIAATRALVGAGEELHQVVAAFTDRPDLMYALVGTVGDVTQVVVRGPVRVELVTPADTRVYLGAPEGGDWAGHVVAVPVLSVALSVEADGVAHPVTSEPPIGTSIPMPHSGSRVETGLPPAGPPIGTNVPRAAPEPEPVGTSLPRAAAPSEPPIGTSVPRSTPAHTGPDPSGPDPSGPDPSGPDRSDTAREADRADREPRRADPIPADVRSAPSDVGTGSVAVAESPVDRHPVAAEYAPAHVTSGPESADRGHPVAVPEPAAHKPGTVPYPTGAAILATPPVQAPPRPPVGGLISDVSWAADTPASGSPATHPSPQAASWPPPPPASPALGPRPAAPSPPVPAALAVPPPAPATPASPSMPAGPQMPPSVPAGPHVPPLMPAGPQVSPPVPASLQGPPPVPAGPQMPPLMPAGPQGPPLVPAGPQVPPPVPDGPAVPLAHPAASPAVPPAPTPHGSGAPLPAGIPAVLLTRGSDIAATPVSEAAAAPLPPAPAPPRQSGLPALVTHGPEAWTVPLTQVPGPAADSQAPPFESSTVPQSAPPAPPRPDAHPPTTTPEMPAQPAQPGQPAQPAPAAWFGNAASPPENLDVTIWRPIAATSVMAAGSTVQAVVCVAGHPNPPGAVSCRVCAQPVPPQPAVAIPRPPLGALRMSTGDSIRLDHGVIFGRDPGTPDANRRDQPYFVKLTDKDISRRHLEVVLDGWDVVALDLNSSNGSAVTPPGGVPEVIPGGQRRLLVPGTVVHLSDTVSFVFEVRQ